MSKRVRLILTATYFSFERYEKVLMESIFHPTASWVPVQSRFLMYLNDTKQRSDAGRIMKAQVRMNQHQLEKKTNRDFIIIYKNIQPEN